MKRVIRFLTAATYLAATLFFSINVNAAPSDIDTTFAAALGIVPGGRISDFAIQSDGKIIVVGEIGLINGVSRPVLARLNPDGSVDTSFVPPLIVNGGPGFAIVTVALQSNDKILIGGHVASINGVPRKVIARLNADGSPDIEFNSSPALNDVVHVQNIEVLPDDRIVIGGTKVIGGSFQGVIVRLTPDGTLDAEALNVAADFVFQPDGKILRSDSNGVSRLNPDLTNDNTFENIGLGGKMVFQSDGKIVVAGSFTMFNGFPIGRIARLNTDGSFDATFNQNGAGANVASIAAISMFQDGRIIIGGNFTAYNGTPRSGVAVVNPDGTLDKSVVPQTEFFNVDSISVQQDGKPVISGFHLQQAAFVHGSITRLDPDGTRDPGFLARTARPGTGQRAVVMPDGRIVVIGAFNDANGVSRNSLARFNMNGSLDEGRLSPYASLTPELLSLDVQPDGKLIIGTLNGNAVRQHSDGSTDILYSGTFRSRAVKALPEGKVLIAAQASGVHFLRRFNADGSLDGTFGTVVNDEIMTVFVQADGKIMIGGKFTQVNSTPRGRVARLNSDGTLDATFDPPGGANNTIVDIDVQSTGHVIIGGLFTGVNFSDQRYLARLNPDGSHDAAFDPVFTSTGTTEIRAVKVQPDNKVLVGGFISMTDSIVTGSIIRLTSTGSLDAAFSHGRVSGGINDIALQSDGKIILVGEFSGGGVGIARLLNISASAFDFDGDGRADVSVFRPSTNRWYEFRSSDSQVEETTFGVAGDVPVPADFDGDGKTDEAIFRPSTGTWWYQGSITGTHNATQFGRAGDVPRPSDFDGDGKADFIVYRPSNSVWYRAGTTGELSIIQFGIAEDKPIIGDFDGDGKSDLAVYRPSTGTWWYAVSGSPGQFHAVQFGISTDIPAAADYDGDGRTDLAVYRPSEGLWYILNSSNGSVAIAAFGVAEDRPVPADYDGDGRADIAVFRPSTGIWYLLQSTSGFTAYQFGVGTDVAIQGAYIP